MPYTHFMLFRKFNGKTFKFFDLKQRERDAQAVAAKLRGMSKPGGLQVQARVVHIKGSGFGIYKRFTRGE